MSTTNTPKSKADAIVDVYSLRQPDKKQLDEQANNAAGQDNNGQQAYLFTKVQELYHNATLHSQEALNLSLHAVQDSYLEAKGFGQNGLLLDQIGSKLQSTYQNVRDTALDTVKLNVDPLIQSFKDTKRQLIIFRQRHNRHKPCRKKSTLLVWLFEAVLVLIETMLNGPVTAFITTGGGKEGELLAGAIAFCNVLSANLIAEFFKGNRHIDKDVRVRTRIFTVLMIVAYLAAVYGLGLFLMLAEVTGYDASQPISVALSGLENHSVLDFTGNSIRLMLITLAFFTVTFVAAYQGLTGEAYPQYKQISGECDASKRELEQALKKAENTLAEPFAFDEDELGATEETLKLQIKALHEACQVLNEYKTAYQMVVETNTQVCVSSKDYLVSQTDFLKRRRKQPIELPELPEKNTQLAEMLAELEALTERRQQELDRLTALAQSFKQEAQQQHQGLRKAYLKEAYETFHAINTGEWLQGVEQPEPLSPSMPAGPEPVIEVSTKSKPLPKHWGG